MKVLICDNHQIVRAGIQQLLQECPIEKEIIGVDNGTEAIALLQSDHFEIVLLNVSLPGISGFELLELIKKKWHNSKVLMLSMKTSEKDAILAFRLGASGYLTTDSAPEELFNAMKKILSGGKYISNDVAEKIAIYIENNVGSSKHDTLSNREFMTMIKLARGETLKQIGEELLISNKTVSTYRSRIMQKMNFSKNTQLTRYCLEHELI